ncbi:membrane protein insertase YidC [Pelagibius sp.]|uniref:membrane protein insertase YidC n=1 Tax=Pelagibius sp. TaxID=1931238 RepID=UPI00260783F0|nr:membrane protein insertase YidC [Pelagibius sp.]
MEQRNLLLAIVLSVAILFGFQMLFPPPPPPVQQPETVGEQGSTPVPGQGAAPSIPGLPGGVPAAQVREEAIGISPRIEIDSENLGGSIALRGAKLDDLVLRQFRETLDEDSPLITYLSPEGSADPYFARFGWAAAPGTTVTLPDAQTLWQSEGGTLTPDTPVTLRWNNGEGLTFEQVFELDDEYLFTVTQRVVNDAGAEVQLAPFGLISRTNTPEILGFFILHEGPLGVFDEVLKEVDYDELKDDFEGRDVVIETPTTGGWIGITDKYWLAALIPEQSQAVKTRFLYNQRDGRDHYQTDMIYDATAVPAGGSVEITNRLFAGAKEVVKLDAYEEQFGIVGFDRAVDFGWFYYLTKPLFYALHWLNATLGNFGLAILALTVAIKLVFFPLANKSYRSMAKMRKLQPQMLELRERFAEDKQRLNQEMMALYKREGANPLSGCLPILIQIPVFFALYKVMFVTIEMRHAPFYGWIQDLSAPDPTSILNGFGLLPWGVPELGILNLLNLGVWPLLMGISMFLQQKLNPQPPDPVQAKIFLMMPIIFTFLLATFPAGLVIYWTWNNVLSIAQQAIIMKRAGVPIGGGSATKPTT